MKYYLLLLLALVCFHGISQDTPQKINYQGVARSANGNPIGNKSISLRFRILQAPPSVSAVFTESLSVSTNAFGLFTHQIGSIAPLNTVNWALGPYYLETAIDTTNGTSFVVAGTQQLVSVPYALRAASAPAPAVSFNPLSGELSVGGNTVTIPTNTATPATTTITTAGALSSTVNGNLYNLFTPSVTVTQAPMAVLQPSNMAEVLGAFPNYTVRVAPVIGYNPLSGVLTLSSSAASSPSYAYNYLVAPQPAVVGNVLSVGPPSNSVTLPSPAVTPNTTLTSSGGLISIQSPVTNSFNINLVTPTLTPGGSASVTGTYPNYTISAPPSGSVNLTQSGAISITGSSPNYVISTPSVLVSASSTGLGQIQGNFPNYVVNVAPTFSYNNAAGALVVSNSASPAISYTYPLAPAPAFTNGILTIGPSFNTVAIPGAVTPTISGAGAASVNTSGSNYTVTVPVTSVVAGNGISVTGSAPIFTVNSTSTSPTITGTGVASVTTAGNSYTVDVPLTTLTGSNGLSVANSGSNFTLTQQSISLAGQGGGVSIGGSYPSYTINTPSVSISPTVSLMPNAGLLQKMGSYPNYTFLVAPVINYNGLTGILTLSNIPTTTPSYNYTYNVTPNLAVTNNVITSGPSTNSVALTTPAAQAIPVSGSGAVVLGGLILMPTAFTKQTAASEIDVFVHTQASIGLSLSNFKFELVVDGNTSSVSVPHTIEGSLSGKTEYITLKSVFSGLSAGSHTVGIKVTGGLGINTTLDPNAYGANLILKETY